MSTTIDTILLVGHGSRAKAGNAEVEEFACQWKKRNPTWKIEVCYIEYADVLLDAGLEKAAKGCTSKRVVIVPLILNAAGHVKMEVPIAIDQARDRFPDVEFILTPHLGANQEVLKLLNRRLKSENHKLSFPDPKTTGVILLGRGSSDKVANGEVAKMARWILEENENELVEVAFTGVTFPRLETVVQRMEVLGMMQVIVLPYYLFNGRLIQRIESQIERLEGQYPQITFGLGKYFGFEEEIYQLLNQRVAEATGSEVKVTMLECDGCHHRKEAEASHVHHHHDDGHEHGGHHHH